MNQRDIEDDEISLQDLWQAVRNRWRRVALTGMAGMALGGLVAFGMPPVWEATSIIQVGQVGQVGEVGERSMESAADAAERLKSGAFIASVAAKLGVEQKSLAEQVKVSVLKSSSFIEVKVRGDSRDTATKRAKMIVSTLADIHADLAKPFIQSMEDALAGVQVRIKEIQAARSRLEAQVLQPKEVDQRFSEYALLMGVYLEKGGELDRLQQRELALRLTRGHALTRPTQIVGAIYSPEVPVLPKRGLSLILGLIVGIFSGLMWIFLARHGGTGKLNAV